MLQIIKRHQYLRGCQALRFQQLRPFMRQRDLACSGGRLRVLYAASSALGQFQPPRAQSDRARRANDDLMPRRDRKRVVEGKSVSVRVDLGGRRNIKKKKKNK